VLALFYQKSFMKPFRCLLLVLVCLCAVPLGYASDSPSGSSSGSSPENASDNVLENESQASHVAELTDNLTKLKNFQSDFEQRVTDSRGQIIEQSGGVLYLQSPGKFKWEYANEEQLIVSDGEKIYFQMNDLEQVIVRDFQEALASVPSLILVSDLSKLSTLFNIKQQAVNPTVDEFKLTPKSTQAAYSAIYLQFSGGQFSSLSIVDALGQTTEILISGQPNYDAVSVGQFNYKTPEGYDVVSG
jgi:outer membrane lipoprotein carrier protein